MNWEFKISERTASLLCVAPRAANSRQPLPYRITEGLPVMRPKSGSGSRGSQEGRVNGSGPEPRGAGGDLLGCDASPHQLGWRGDRWIEVHCQDRTSLR